MDDNTRGTTVNEAVHSSARKKEKKCDWAAFFSSYIWCMLLIAPPFSSCVLIAHGVEEIRPRPRITFIWVVIGKKQNMQNPIQKKESHQIFMNIRTPIIQVFFKTLAQNECTKSCPTKLYWIKEKNVKCVKVTNIVNYTYISVNQYFLTFGRIGT
jgi:hypothetical protein